MLSFFPRGVLDEILNLIESFSEDFPSYSYCNIAVKLFEVTAFGRTHAAPYRGYGYVPLRLGGTSLGATTTSK